MVSIPFVKMAGAGNDFIVIEARRKFDYAAFARSACARRTGIGADGVLVLDKSTRSDYRMRIINADGSEAEMCGNGARCMAAYIAANFKPAKIPFGMETLAGEILAKASGQMAQVRLSDPKDYRPELNIKVDGRNFQAHYIDTGVPHAVIFVKGLQKVDVNGLGVLVRHHTAFAPRGTNVDFVEYVQQGQVAVRTFERGVEAETLACGTGAVASALVSYLRAHPQAKKQKRALMKVLTAGREILEITFDLDEGAKINNVWLKGSAKLIAKGEYYYHNVSLRE